MDKTAIKKKILDFTVNGVEKFLQEHPTLEFYAFAYDYNASEAVINLCFNTEAEFEKSLTHYKNGKYADRYQSEEAIKELRYNTGDWGYSFFKTLDVLTREEVDNVYDSSAYEVWSAYVENLSELFCECLIDFTRTETYKKIPKTNDFIVFCSDDDEHPDTSQERFERVKARYN